MSKKYPDATGYNLWFTRLVQILLILE